MTDKIIKDVDIIESSDDLSEEGSRMEDVPDDYLCINPHRLPSDQMLEGSLNIIGPIIDLPIISLISSSNRLRRGGEIPPHIAKLSKEIANLIMRSSKDS